MKSRTGKALQIALAMGCLLGGAALEVEAKDLAFSTFLGGSGSEWPDDIAVDGTGNIWVMGTTASADFPTTANALDRTLNRNDVYLAKLGPDGTLLYSTLLGGSGDEVGLGVALDPAGNVYVAGHTDSVGFPRVGGLPANLHGTGREIFVAKLSPSGSSLLYSTTFGGSGSDRAWRIAVDATGAAYVAGETDSRDFPVVGGVQASYGGGPEDAFVAKLSPDGSSLSYSTYLGGRLYDTARGLAVDPEGRAAVGGATLSSDFPNAELGASGGFVTILEASGSAFAFPTFFAGTLTQGLAFGPGGSLYAAGISGGLDAQVSKLDRSGALLLTRYLGGGSLDYAVDIALGPSGHIYLGGLTESRSFPLKDPLQDDCPRGPGPSTLVQVFAAELSPEGSLLFSTYLCGKVGEAASGIAVDPRGNLYVAGFTASPDFPVVNAFQPRLGGFSDEFIAKISPDNQAPDCSGVTASPATLWPPNGKLVPVSIRGITDPEGERLTITITGITQDEPGAAFSGIGSSMALVKAERDGKGDGRVYRIRIEATDPSGASCTGMVAVCVPHDLGKGSCVDGNR